MGRCGWIGCRQGWALTSTRRRAEVSAIAREEQNLGQQSRRFSGDCSFPPPARSRQHCKHETAFDLELDEICDTATRRCVAFRGSARQRTASPAMGNAV